MTLTLVVLTKDGGARLDRLLRWADTRPYINQIHIWRDRASAEQEIDMRKRLARRKPQAAYTRIRSIDVVNIDSALAQCHSQDNVKTDWALHLGDDELLGQWFDEDVERLMRAPYDVYSLPRYNVVLPDGMSELQHISSRPWYPDYAQRLFRPGSLVHSGEIHEGAQVDGRMAMARPHIFHFDFLDQTLAERQAKWKRYEKQGVAAASVARGLAPDYYRRWCVPEDFEHEVAPCEEQL